MKNRITSAIVLLLLFFSSLSYCRTDAAGMSKISDLTNQGDTLKVLSSPTIAPLVNLWAGKFSSANPSVTVSVSEVSGLTSPTSDKIFITAAADRESAIPANTWKMVIGHDAVVPFINAANPNLGKLMVRGIKASEIANLLASGKPTDWSDIIKGGNPGAVKIHMAGSEDIKAAVADFTGTDASVMNVSVVEEPGKIISVIEKDINSIGFSKLADLMKDNGNELAGNIVFLPIDRNGNGRIDSFEKIYGNPEELTRGIWIGKYPSSLCGSIYALSSEKPAGKDQVAFLKWILTDGSQHLASKGYISLLGMETESGLVALTGTPINAVTDVRPSNYYAGIIIIASITALVILISVLITRAAKSKKVPAKTVTHVRSAFNEEAIASPGGLLFDKSHTWTFMERDGLIRFGIDDFIQNVTGALTGIRLKETGEFVRRGEKILSIVKDGKQIDLYSPVSGTIKSLNTNLSIDPSLVNSSPYTDGWIYLIEPRNWAREMQLMFMADKYRQWITDEFDRLKTFLSSVPRENSTCAHVILQDGGELTHNVLGDMEPEVWAEFQTRFIDTSR